MSRLLHAASAVVASLLLASAATAQGGISDGTSNTIIVGERPLGTTGCTVVTTRGPAGPGQPNTLWSSVYLRRSAGACGLPIAAPTCPVGRVPLSRVLDGTSNTIYVGEAPGPWCVGDIGGGRCAVQTLPGLITDGTSNTLLVGELLPPLGGPEPLECALPIGGAGCVLGGPGSISDGTSNTILFSEVGAGQGCLLPVAGTRDLPDVRVGPGGGICTPTAGGIRDGTSNTIIVGECAPAVAAVPEPSAVVLLGAGLAALAALAGARGRRAG